MASLQAIGREVIWFFSKLPGMRYGSLQLCRYGLLPQSVWKRIPVDGSFEVSISGGSTFRYVSVRNDQIGRRLFWGGIDAFEPETVREFISHARGASLILDIGANTGLYAMLACTVNPAATVIAVEPVPRINALLQQNIVANQLEDRCRSIAAAISDRIGVATFHVPTGDVPTSASLKQTGFRGTDGALITVDVLTVDSLISGLGRVDLVKIDVEGFEDQVLQGMTNTLTAFRPTIILECNPDGPYQEIDSILTSFGYRFFHIRDQELAPLSRITPDPIEKFRNFLCIHNSRCME